MKPEPVKVESFATGVKAEGLANLLARAEDLMKQGKYITALDQFAAAEAVARRLALREAVPRKRKAR